MGAHAGVHVEDAAIHGSDALATSLVLAKALEHTGFDLALTGMAWRWTRQMLADPSMQGRPARRPPGHLRRASLRPSEG
ncbi:MAG: hypothetical protein R2734_17025 [Nocardioides sp.]